MTNRDRVVEYLQSIAPADTTNQEISARTGIKPQQQVLQITAELRKTGLITGVQAGKEWRFWWGGPKARLPTPPPAPSNTSEVCPWDTTDALGCQIQMTWAPIGRVILRNDRLEFPAAEPTSAVYRFRLRGASGQAIYFGESQNLRQRFSLYQNADVSQQTNFRLKNLFIEALRSGAEIGVAMITAGAWIDLNGTRLTADFTSKVVRRIFEHAAILGSDGTAIDSLNR